MSKEGVGRTIEQKIRLSNEMVSYGLSYQIDQPGGPAVNVGTSRRDGFQGGGVPLGMRSPSVANWYLQTFLSVRIDQVSLHEIPLIFHEVRNGGKDSLIEGSWQTPQGKVHLRLALRSGDDKLLMQITADDSIPLERMQVKVTAYPQAFSQPRDRRAVMAGREATAPDTLRLKKDDHDWVLFYDQVQQDEGTGDGPCGLVYVADEVQTAQVHLGSYSVSTTLVAKPQGRTITIGLWDFTGYRNLAEARQLLQSSGDDIVADLSALSKVNWQKSPLPPAHLSKQDTSWIAELLEKRRQPNAFDQMTGKMVTPHIRWAKPLRGGPIKTLAIGPRWNQRETVELAQRLDMTYETVSLSQSDKVLVPEWLYLYQSYETYGYMRKNESDVLTDLERKLDSDFDTILLSGTDIRIIPKPLIEKLVKKIESGTGLVLFGESKKLLDPLKDQLTSTPWDPEVVPLDQLPTLSQMVQSKQPVWTAYTLGKGRVLVFNYPAGGRSTRLSLTPALDNLAPNVSGYYDYYHSLLASGMMWASRREPEVTLNFIELPQRIAVRSSQRFSGAKVILRIHDPVRQYDRTTERTIDLAKGLTQLSLEDMFPAGAVLATGPRFVSVRVQHDGKALGWGTTHADLGKEKPHLASIELDRKMIRPGEKVSGSITLEGFTGSLDSGLAVQLRVWDNYGRLLHHRTAKPSKSKLTFEFVMDRPISLLHRVQVVLRDQGGLLDQGSDWFTVTSPREAIDDFHFLVWSDGGNNAVVQGINRVLAQGGVDWIDNTAMLHGNAETNTNLCLNAARFNLRSIPYITRIASMQSGNRHRDPCLSDPVYQQEWTAGLKERTAGAMLLNPPAYSLGDENFLVHGDLDVCTAPPTMKLFRKWLQQNYGSLAKLNQIWHTVFSDWSDVMPATLAEIQETTDHWPRWADHRVFMDQVFTDAHRRGRDAIREVDPDARVGFDGLFKLDSRRGYDFYHLCRTCDLAQVYANYPVQVEYVRSWRQPDAVVGGWYNTIGNRNEASARWLGWHLLLHQFNSSWYWMAYGTGPALLFPDLRPTPQFRWMRDTHLELMGGIGKLLLHAKRQHDGVAIYCSQTSLHASKLMDRQLASAHESSANLVEDMGLQFNMVSPDQAIAGELSQYKVVLLPACDSMSQEEADVIRQFVQRGGLVIADSLPAILDEHLDQPDDGLLDDLFGVQRSGLPQRASGVKVAKMQVKHEGLDLAVPFRLHETGLQTTDSTAWADSDGHPCVIVNTVQEGKAVLLNTRIESYKNVRYESAESRKAVLQLTRQLFSMAGVQSPIRVTAGDSVVDTCEIVRFTDGDYQYVAIHESPQSPDPKPKQVTIEFPEFPEVRHVYDIRNAKSLGKVRRIEAQLVPGEPLLYALLPQSIKAVRLTTGRKSVSAGTAAEFQVSLVTASGPATGPHCLRMKVFRPDGKIARHYTQKILTDQFPATITVPFAKNDVPGRWQIQVTDIATGLKANREIEVRKE